MLRAGELEKVVQLVEASTGSRTSDLVAHAAFESEDYLPPIKEAAALIVALLKKMNLYDEARSYIARYPSVNYKLTVEIANQLVKEKDARLLQDFVTIFVTISEFPLKDYVDRISSTQGTPTKRW